MSFINAKYRNSLRLILKSEYPQFCEIFIEEFLDFLDNNTKKKCLEKAIPVPSWDIIKEVYYQKDTKINNFLRNIRF